MRGKEPSEQLWHRLKQAADEEPASVTVGQAAKRVRKVTMDAGVDALPEAAERFYAAEYVRMVNERLSGDVGTIR